MGWDPRLLSSKLPRCNDKHHACFEWRSRCESNTFAGVVLPLCLWIQFVWSALLLVFLLSPSFWALLIFFLHARQPCLFFFGLHLFLHPPLFFERLFQLERYPRSVTIPTGHSWLPLRECEFTGDMLVMETSLGPLYLGSSSCAKLYLWAPKCKSWQRNNHATKKYKTGLCALFCHVHGSSCA